MPLVRAVFSGPIATRLLLVCEWVWLLVSGPQICPTRTPNWYVDGWTTKKRRCPRDVSIVRVSEVNVWCISLGPGVFCGPMCMLLCRGFPRDRPLWSDRRVFEGLAGCRWMAWWGAFPKWPCGFRRTLWRDVDGVKTLGPRDHPLQGSAAECTTPSFPGLVTRMDTRGICRQGVTGSRGVWGTFLSWSDPSGAA